MILLCWCIMLLCLSVNSESVIMCKDPGGNVTLKCSSEKCPPLITGYVAMYLYHERTGQEEVLYYSKGFRSPDNVAPRQRYNGRIQTTGSFMSHSITISNLTVDDTGLYSCVYAKEVKYQVKCDVYAVIVTGAASCSTTAEEKSPPLVLIITAVCITAAISMLVTLIFILVIWLTVQQCRRSRRIARNIQSLSHDYVYEVMTKNGFHPDAAQEDSSPYEFLACQTSSSRGLV
ncbi:uncharacterized protein LOC111582202 [Amphiprion ocellaris]|uniref:uncharacterized protein LOC111582202 n=1 Tax=Amphiprion ocellaris TaxID=80972 RepID=UPI0024115567|nr:uncharacterized protein LOC111582202 [Amphiprion ocellaris]